MLNVYKASAGSGKTYRLAYEYIKMLLGRRSESGDHYQFYTHYNNPHRRILAVTFTNKATEEMKQRIVKQLEVLAHRTSQSDYFDQLCKAFNCGEAQLKKNAEQVLQQLLHDFSYFNISTIDSFFQQVLRAFAREVGLQGGYEVEMDSDYVTMAAIEQMFGELDENPDRLEWLNQYAEENIRNDGNWNIFGSSDISALAKQLDKEEYKKYRDKLAAHDLQSYKEYIETLTAHRDTIRSRIVSEAEKVIKAIELEGITPEVFTRGWIKCVYTIAQVNEPVSEKVWDNAIHSFIKYYNSPKSWFAATKLKKHHLGVEGLTQNLTPAFEVLANLLSDTYSEYISVPICLKHIYALGVLSTIDRYVAQYERDHNSMLLSKTPDILSALINESDAPFIYEKVGTRIEHYMIDEFQDTSNLQWRNFEPLVSESLARNNENLIVGDVKQSIYRWRNSDWRLLHEELDKRFSYNEINKGRDTNWRSCAHVIEFNNAFFRRAAMLMQDDIKTALEEHSIKHVKPIIQEVFDNVAQNVSSKHAKLSGRVAVNILTVENVGEFETEVMQRLPGTIRSLLNKGYRQKDIAFLVRTRDEGRKIVELLLALSAEGEDCLRDLHVVSDESLLISNAPPVKLIVGILRYLQNPSYPINELILAYEYGLMSASHDADTLPSQLLARYFDKQGETYNLEPELLAFIEDIASKPLFEMCERIVHKFKMHEQVAYVGYVEAFQDIVVEYSQTHSADLFSFLRWWSEKEKTAAVKLPENLDAITVMTIHKSKGLEFPVVILPFATWKFSSQGGYAPTLKWYEPQIEPFNLLPVLPVNYDAKLASSIFAPQYYKELISEYIDCLNLTYVAFTRAGQELVAYSYVREKGTGNSIGSLIKNVLDMPQLYDEDSSEMDLASHMRTIEHEDGSAPEYLFEVGVDYKPVFESSPMAQMLDVNYNVVIPSEQRLKQRLTAQNKSGSRVRNYGILMHEILAEIVCVQDVHDVVSRYVREGKLKRAQQHEIEEKITRLIAQSRVSRWFSPDVRVVTETAILKSGEKINRPDRVVIDGDCVTVVDYKFGQIELDEYKDKVAKYMQLVRDMGYNRVEGCIWYVEKEKFVEVE
ncbi:MAG: UvrD-helicase domain-containing protein [Bacteroidaceae bacterium]|nr:UvrD-helicase domain-containing protein [Bacteroidaceae bacterium]